VIESPVSSFPGFGTVHFTNATANGKPVSSFTTFPLTGGAFSVTYLRE
jgi:hypothetical protein